MTVTPIVPPPKENCTGANEFFSEGRSPCGNRCEQICCKCSVVNIKADEGCDCNPGFARNPEGKCISVKSIECLLLRYRTRYCPDSGAIYPIKGPAPPPVYRRELDDNL